MGTYTSNLKLYKPDLTEFVDVDTQLNDNWKVADKFVKRLMEYEYTDRTTPDIDDTITRSRYYKTYSNSINTYFTVQGFFYQDPGAFVSTWVKAGSLLNSPYVEHPDYPVCWRIIRKASSPTTAEIEWSGAFWIGGSALTLNTNVSGVMTLPTDTIPVVTKYFTVNAGNTTSNYSIARVGFFTGTNDLQFKRYGAAAGNTTDENRIELTGIKYNVEVTG